MGTTTETQSGNRRPRFVRSRDAPAIALTPRDEEILRALARHRFLNSVQIQKLIPGSPQKILRRLQALYHAGYIDRPIAQKDYYAQEGSAPLVYAPANKGMRHLNFRDAGKYPNYEWKRKNDDVRRPFIEHTLEVANLHVALTAGARARPDLQLIHANALIENFPQAPTAHDRAFQWTTAVRHNGHTIPLSVNPDYAFALASATIGRRCYLAEVDRATMPLERADYSMTSIARKLDTYIHGHAAKLHEKQFGWKALRVLFVTYTPERAANMRTVALANLTKNPNSRRLFYFTDAAALYSGDVLSHSWTDGNGEPQTLI